MERVAQTLNVEIGEKFDIVYTKNKRLYGRSFKIQKKEFLIIILSYVMAQWFYY